MLKRAFEQPGPIRVLIADDRALVRTGFRKILESQPDLKVVGEAADGAEAVEASLLLHPEVVLMDIRTPRLDGLEATRRLVGRARLLILTTFDPKRVRVRGAGRDEALLPACLQAARSPTTVSYRPGPTARYPSAPIPLRSGSIPGALFISG